MGSKKENSIRDGETRLNVLNDKSRYTTPGINRISKTIGNNANPSPENNGNNTNLEQEVGNLGQKMQN